MKHTVGTLWIFIYFIYVDILHILTPVMLIFAALATLKPQAGLVAPQVAPASQPAAVVSVHWKFLQLVNTLTSLIMCLKPQGTLIWQIDLFTCWNMCVAQGAGGEPMEVSEQVGMTPEIIQKVNSPPPPLCHLSLGWLLSLHCWHCLPFSQLQDKATVLTTERKKVTVAVSEELRLYCTSNWRLLRYLQISLDIEVWKMDFICFFGIQRGKTVPEELVRAEDLSKYRQVASHAVSLSDIGFSSVDYKVLWLGSSVGGPQSGYGHSKIFQQIKFHKALEKYCSRTNQHMEKSVCISQTAPHWERKGFSQVFIDVYFVYPLCPDLWHGLFKKFKTYISSVQSPWL